MVALRQLGLAGTELAKAQCDTIRLKLHRIGAQIRITVRKVWFVLSESYPFTVVSPSLQQPATDTAALLVETVD